MFFQKYIARFREDLSKEPLLQNKIKQYLLNNAHKLTLVMNPGTFSSPPPPFFLRYLVMRYETRFRTHPDLLVRSGYLPTLPVCLLAFYLPLCFLSILFVLAFPLALDWFLRDWCRGRGLGHIVVRRFYTPCNG